MSRETVREITAYVGKRRPKKERPPPPSREPAPGTPTPERISKEPEEFAKVVVVPGNAYTEPHVVHRVQLPVDSYRRHLKQAQIDAGLMFCQDAIAKDSQAVTANYDGSTRSTPGPRSGGVNDRQRESYIRYHDIYGKLTDDERLLVDNLVQGVKRERTGRPMSMQELARLLGSDYADDASNTKVGLGLLKGALTRLYHEYLRYQVATRQSRKLTEIEETNRAKALSSVRPQLKGPR